MIFTILSRMGFDLDKVVLKVQGDDSIIALLCCFLLIATAFLTLFQHYATHYFNAFISLDKSEIREGLDDAEVLKYRNKGGIPYRDRVALLAQLRHPERSTRPEAVAARCVGIAYAACGQDPLVYQICEDIYLYLTQKKSIVPDQRTLDTFFRYISDEVLSQSDISASRFPTYLETMAHLLDNDKPLANHHWPKDYFIGLPGRR